MDRLPDVSFGEPQDEQRDDSLPEIDDEDDDEELSETPADVVDILGFDPLECLSAT